MGTTTDLPNDLRQRWLLGVDAGGTKTTAWVARAIDGQDIEVVGRATAGIGNRQAAGDQVATASLQTSISEAAARAHVSIDRLHAVCVGGAGLDRGDDSKFIESLLQDIGCQAQVAVVNDARLLLGFISPHSAGVAVIAGTGSLVVGQESSGETFRVGGWGYLIDDVGGGYWLGRELLQAATRLFDRSNVPASHLQILNQLGVATFPELIPVIYGGDSRDIIAGLAPLVIAMANQADPVSQEVVARGATLLGDQVSTAFERLGPNSGGELVLGGSLLTRQPNYREAVIGRVSEFHPNIRAPIIAEHPVEGALRLALRLLDE